MTSTTISSFLYHHKVPAWGVGATSSSVTRPIALYMLGLMASPGGDDSAVPVDNDDNNNSSDPKKKKKLYIKYKNLIPPSLVGKSLLGPY